MHIFSGLHKGRTIQAPKGLKTRPTSGRLREALFNICQPFDDVELFLDLFAGSGAMGLEALSRGAKRVIFVDNCRESIKCIQQNVTTLGCGRQAEIIYGDVFETINKFGNAKKQFDLVYADPPYDLGFGEKLLKKIDELKLVKSFGSFFLEEATGVVPQEIILEDLALKSSREAGRSSLWHYVKK